MKNWVLWMINLEAVVVGAMCMLIAALAHGKGMLIAFGIAEGCTVWVTFFLQVNAEIIGRKAARLAEKIKRKAERCGRSARKIEDITCSPAKRISFPGQKGKVKR